MSASAAPLEGAHVSEAAYECNGQMVSAEAFYAVACDPRRSVAVEACAGSGKTWMLVSRIARALLESPPDQALRPQDILAITFTRKAAGEMRERLQEWLAQWAQASDAECAEALLQRGMTAAQAALRAADLRALHGRLLAGGDGVQFRTFHAWFISLIGAAPMAVLEQLDLPLSPVLLEDDSRAVALLWRPFFKALLQDPAALADYRALVAHVGRFTAHQALESLLARRLEFGLADAQGRLEASVASFGAVWPDWQGLPHPDALLAHRPQAAQTLRAAAKALGAGTAALQKSAVLLEQGVSELVALPDDAPQLPSAVQAIIQILLTKDARPRWATQKAASHPDIRAAQDLAVQWLAVQEQHSAWLHHRRMCRLGRVLLREFAALKRARSWMDMADVERGALALLSDARLSAWVCQKLDTQVRHVLIDEFQDTNPLQWQALSSWLDGYAGAGGGRAPSVFVVGDPKQSIYRFRRAEPAVMLAAQRFVVDGLGGDLLRCDHTRRNAPGVLSAINRLMGDWPGHAAMEGFRPHTTACGSGGLVALLPPVPREGPTTRVQDPLAPAAPPVGAWRDSLQQARQEAEASLRAQESEQVAQEVLRLLAQGLAAQEVMLLARKRDRLQLMAQALQAKGIAARIGEAGSLGDAPEVQDILALVDAALSSEHNLSLARALKSPLFSAADADLVAIAELCRQAPSAARPSWWQVLLSPQDHGGPVQWPSHPALQRAQRDLPRWQAWLQGLPPHDALSHIFSDGDVVARFVQHAPAHRQVVVLRHMQALLGSALSLDSGRYLSIHRWLRALRSGEVDTPSPSAEGAVRLLTIHGAKGLEARAVIVLDTDTQTKGRSGPSVLMDWPIHRSGPERLVFLLSESRAPHDATELLDSERAARDREELNALYVAVTRAQDRLLFSSVEAAKSPSHSWWARAVAAGLPNAPDSAVVDGAAVVACESAVHSPTAAVLREVPAFTEANAGGPEPLSKGSSGVAADVAPHAVPEAAWASIWRGKLMHWMLERHAVSERCSRGEGAPTAQPQDLSGLMLPAARWAQTHGIPPESAQDWAQDAAQQARLLVQGPGAWAWDSAEIDWWANEVEVWCADGAEPSGDGRTGAGRAGQLGRIDRLVRQRSTGHWWVLDYKSSLNPRTVQEGTEQVRLYMRAVAAMHPGQVVVGALLSPSGVHRVDAV